MTQAPFGSPSGPSPVRARSRPAATAVPLIVLAIAGAFVLVVLVGTTMVAGELSGVLLIAAVVVAAPAAAVVFGALVAMIAAQRREVRIDDDTLTVRSLLGAARVDLGRLASVRRARLRATRGVAPARSVVVADRDGRSTTVNLHLLDDPDAVADRLRQAAARSGADVDAAAERRLGR